MQRKGRLGKPIGLKGLWSNYRKTCTLWYFIQNREGKSLVESPKPNLLLLTFLFPIYSGMKKRENMYNICNQESKNRMLPENQDI